MNRKDLEKLGLTVEVLEKAGLTEDFFNQVIILHGKDIEAHKTKLTTAEAQVVDLQTRLGEADKTIKAFEGMDVEGVKKAAADWEAKAKQATIDAEALVAGLKFDHALEAQLKQFKVRDPQDVIHHLKKDLLKMDDQGSIVGLKEQIEPLVEKKPYLFETADDASSDPDPKIVSTSVSGTTASSDAFSAALEKGAGITLPK